MEVVQEDEFGFPITVEQKETYNVDAIVVDVKPDNGSNDPLLDRLKASMGTPLVKQEPREHVAVAIEQTPSGVRSLPSSSSSSSSLLQSNLGNTATRVLMAPDSGSGSGRVGTTTRRPAAAAAAAAAMSLSRVRQQQHLPHLVLKLYRQTFYR